MPSDVRGAHVRYFPAAEEDATHEDYKNVVQEVAKQVLEGKLDLGGMHQLPASLHRGVKRSLVSQNTLYVHIEK